MRGSGAGTSGWEVGSGHIKQDGPAYGGAVERVADAEPRLPALEEDPVDESCEESRRRTRSIQSLGRGRVVRPDRRGHSELEKAASQLAGLRRTSAARRFRDAIEAFAVLPRGGIKVALWPLLTGPQGQSLTHDGWEHDCCRIAMTACDMSVRSSPM